MTETWCPEIGDSIRVTDNSYTGCEERPTIGQVGEVTSTFSIDGLSVLVIEFVATKHNKVSLPGKKTFKEYFCTKRLPYLYFEPAKKWGKAS